MKHFESTLQKWLNLQNKIAYLPLYVHFAPEKEMDIIIKCFDAGCQASFSQSFFNAVLIEWLNSSHKSVR